MDQTLTLKLAEFQKALATLQEAITLEKNAVVRDSVIKRFEYAFELAWKTGKVLLEEKFGVNVFSPKECFRELRNNIALTDDEVEILLGMTDDRNEVIHTYQEAFANKLYKSITTQYAALLKRVCTVIEKQVNEVN